MEDKNFQITDVIYKGYISVQIDVLIPGPPEPYEFPNYAPKEIEDIMNSVEATPWDSHRADVNKYTLYTATEKLLDYGAKAEYERLIPFIKADREKIAELNQKIRNLQNESK